jgi:hypothetical protein
MNIDNCKYAKTKGTIQNNQFNKVCLSILQEFR